jgi:hypothetical protein
MKSILLVALLLAGFGANAKSATLVYFENGKWVEQSVSIDKRGWPKINHLRISNHEPRIKAVPLFSMQSEELKSETGDTLWKVTNSWDWNWELKFSEWVKAEIDASWWKKYGLATDCADAILTARWVFARNNGLPAANRLGTGAWFTHRSVKIEWETLPTAPEWFNDQKFLAALNYLMNHTFTHTLWKDSYPVAVNTSTILPGGYYLSLHENTGHTQFIYKVGSSSNDIPLTTLNSTVPRAVRDLMEFLFLENSSDESGSGFVRMRWPVWTADQVDLVSPELMPKYSREQFAADFIRSPRSLFWQEVFQRLNPNADYDRIALKIAKQIKDMFIARVAVVEQGYKVCHAQPCAKNSPEYNAWSTPSRDQRLLETIEIFDQICSMIIPSLEVRDVVHSAAFTMNNREYSVSELMGSWRLQIYSSDPNDPPEARWGF